MRKFMRFAPRNSYFRSLLILAGVLALLAAFSPKANAALIRFYDFEGTATPPYPFNLQSHTPAVETGAGTTLFLDNGTPGSPYPSTNTLAVTPGLPVNLPPGAGPNNTSAGFNHSQQFNMGVEIPFPSSQGIYDITSVSFAYANTGNGFSAVQLQMSTNGGLTFNTNLSGLIALPQTGNNGAVITISIPAGTTLNINNLVLRLLFTGGQSNGGNLQFQLDNIQIGGTIVPEPATVAAGLLGILGLCWHQRRRLIRSVRFRRT
jgi:hypothetical protein